MTVSDIRRYELGRFVDYCIEYNEAHGLTDDKPEKKDKRRKATQADWDAFWGR